jgi:hypothetical protein
VTARDDASALRVIAQIARASRMRVPIVSGAKEPPHAQGIDPRRLRTRATQCTPSPGAHHPSWYRVRASDAGRDLRCTIPSTPFPLDALDRIARATVRVLSIVDIAFAYARSSLRLLCCCPPHAPETVVVSRRSRDDQPNIPPRCEHCLQVRLPVLSRPPTRTARAKPAYRARDARLHSASPRCATDHTRHPGRRARGPPPPPPPPPCPPRGPPPFVPVFFAS